MEKSEAVRQLLAAIEQYELESGSVTDLLEGPTEDALYQSISDLAQCYPDAVLPLPARFYWRSFDEQSQAHADACQRIGEQRLKAHAERQGPQHPCHSPDPSILPPVLPILEPLIALHSWLVQQGPAVESPTPVVRLTPNEQEMLKFVSDKPTKSAVIAERCGKEEPAVRKVLSTLQQKGKIWRVPGGGYVRVITG